MNIANYINDTFVNELEVFRMRKLFVHIGLSFYNNLLLYHRILVRSCEMVCLKFTLPEKWYNSVKFELKLLLFRFLYTLMLKMNEKYR